MKISLNWLKDYIQIDETPEKIAQLLTDCGLEVESLEKTESVKGGLKGIVIGEVLTCEKHPDADRLSLTTVDIGEEVLPIVCGAPNVARGQKVVVATVGTTLHPASGESFEIKKAKIRGQESRGMICAEDELGLGTSHDGIMVLDPSVKTGTTAAEYFKVEEDHCIEIGLTPNRIDAASHYGVARDLAAVINHLHPQSKVRAQKPDISNFKPDNNTAGISITVEDHDACPRYTGLCISGIKVQESPDWLKNRLKVIGLKPINNVVDITNFVLHETGQPLHAFDASKIAGNKVIIRKPQKDTAFITLDEEELKLTGNDLMICNEKDPMCLAGILGGMDSGVTEATESIFLESAYFEASGIRKSSKFHTINTDSSFRFERGADPEMTVYALKRAALLIREIAGGKITSEVMDVYPVPVKPCIIHLRYESALTLIGKAIEKETIKKILLSLEIAIKQETAEGLELEIPPYRVDVTREADVVEEILRIYGYNSIELPERLHASIVSSPRPDKEKLQNIASDILSNRGFNEIMNNSLTRANYYQSELFESAGIVHILNPLSQDLGVMRQSLFFGGMETIAWNQNRKVADLKIYEFGNIYFKEENKANEGPLKLSGYREQRMLSLFMSGNLNPESWYAKHKPVTLFDLKAEVMVLLQKMNVRMDDAIAEEIHGEGFLEAGIRFLFNDKPLLELGEVSRTFLKSFDLKQDVFYASVNWELVLELQDKHMIRYSEIPKFPEVRRDLALLINSDVKFSDIERLAKTAEKRLLKKVRLFDIYRDEKIGAGKKSYAVSFSLVDEKKTLTDKEIDKVMERISQTLQKELNASIR
ncbi:MAG: phenylalanine--tRNA ligase subunit beta [Bacteroidetes bacterium]|nr:MAG: phenylalanine--tRNA ligase subunit beta [Bacteroidota bacterium]